MSKYMHIIKRFPLLYKFLLFLYFLFRSAFTFPLKMYYSLKYGIPAERMLNGNTCESKVSSLAKIVESGDSETLAAQTFFIIRRGDNVMGLFSHVSIYLAFIAYSISKGYVPVIDMQNQKNIYISDKDVGKCNAWELFYKQPMNIGINDIPINSRCIYSSRKYLPKRSPFYHALIYDKTEYKMWALLYKRLIEYNKKTHDYVREEEHILPENTRVLGVLCRGTDYTQRKAKNHPKQPSLTVMLEKAKEMFAEWQCEYIYLATEEFAAFEIFNTAFPGKILTNDRTYYDKNGIDFAKQTLSVVHFDRADDEYLKGLQYLSSIHLLSKCDCLLAGACAGTYAAVYINDFKYSRKYIFDLGLY